MTIPFEEGYSGKAQLLHQALLETINCGQFDDMTVAEITGVLFGLAVLFSK
jgi:hypothetical protein